LPPGQAANCTVAVAVGQESTRPVCVVAAALRSAIAFALLLSAELLAADVASSLELSLQAASVPSSAHSATRVKIQSPIIIGPRRSAEGFSS
jgi:hypothetical protein